MKRHTIIIKRQMCKCPKCGLRHVKKVKKTRKGGSRK